MVQADFSFITIIISVLHKRRANICWVSHNRSKEIIRPSASPTDWDEYKTQT
jgi:hypothetical protein